MSKISSEHNDRIAAELREVGAGGYGAVKFASHYLPNVIHPDEHITGVVYGRYKEDSGLLNFSSGMLVATDQRVVFLDHKPGFTSLDEITYDVVAGVKEATNGMFCTVTLHTRVAEYTVRFVSLKAAKIFVQYIESRLKNVGATGQERVSTVTVPPTPVPVATPNPQPGQPVVPEPAAIKFLHDHEVGVLSTIDRTGVLHGAAIYYFLNMDNRICMVTKAGTQKARDMFGHEQVALTIFDEQTAQTVQMRGEAEVVNDAETRQAIIAKLVKLRLYGDNALLPPVTTIHEDGYVALQITPTEIKFHDYKQSQKAEVA
jgi:uncharacterized protein YhbP (UPF0306 family)